MKKLLLILIVPFLSFGQNSNYVTDTVILISAWQGMYDDIFSLHFESLTSKLETIQFIYADTDGDGKYNYEKPSSVKKDTTLEKYSLINFEKMDGLIDSVFIINYTLKKYKLDCSDDILQRYRYKTGNYLINIEQLTPVNYEID
jgi:hypothetical protein